jgi:hypothetical protein
MSWMGPTTILSLCNLLFHYSPWVHTNDNKGFQIIEGVI